MNIRTLLSLMTSVACLTMSARYSSIEFNPGIHNTELWLLSILGGSFASIAICVYGLHSMWAQSEPTEAQARSRSAVAALFFMALAMQWYYSIQIFGHIAEAWAG